MQIVHSSPTVPASPDLHGRWSSFAKRMVIARVHWKSDFLSLIISVSTLDWPTPPPQHPPLVLRMMGSTHVNFSAGSPDASTPYATSTPCKSSCAAPSPFFFLRCSVKSSRNTACPHINAREKPARVAAGPSLKTTLEAGAGATAALVDAAAILIIYRKTRSSTPPPFLLFTEKRSLQLLPPAAGAGAAGGVLYEPVVFAVLIKNIRFMGELP